MVYIQYITFFAFVETRSKALTSESNVQSLSFLVINGPV